MTWSTFAQSHLIESLGWTLAYSVWQLALISVFLLIALRCTVRSSPNIRYVISVAALVLSVIVPLVTFLQIASRSGARVPDRAAYSVEQIDDREINERKMSGSATEVQHAAPDENGPSDQFISLFVTRGFIERNIPALFPFAVLAWLFGVALFSLRLVGGVVQLHKYKTIGIDAADDEWHRRFAGLCKLLRVDHNVRLLRSTFIKTPIAVGLIKPLIIMPASVFLQMDPRQLECIIAHELVHIRRYDCLINILQSVVEIAFFYHPAVWWISATVRREREFAADAAVMQASVDGVTYATALANLEEIRHPTKINAASIAIAANGGNLMQRIQRILNKKTETPHANSVLSTALAVAFISALLVTLFSFSPKPVVNGQKRDNNGRQLAIGFVGIPPLDRSENPPKDSYATAQLLMDVLKSHHIPAMGFVTGSSISDGDKIFPVRAEIVKMWRDQGFEVGIGGFRHLSFYDTPYDEYVANIEKNEAVTKKVLGNETSLRYFSYPYLNTGRSTADRDRFESWLAGQGLSSVKYTVDNQEWMYSYAYDMARNDNDINTMKEIKASFLDYMSKMIDHFENYSRDMFGRDIPQTMVLTTSRLVADTGNDLFGMLEKRGYKFVSINQAQSDPAYQTPEEFMGKAGISWFERWQMKQGKPLLDEPNPDPSVVKTWDTRKPVKSK